MAVIVDGYNVIFGDDELSDLVREGHLQKAREGLVARLVRYQAAAGEDVEVVFDGAVGFGAPRDSRGAVRIAYSRKPATADHIIQQRIDSTLNPRDLKVISNDREIRKHAKGARAASVPVEEFLKEIEALLRPKEDEPVEPGQKYGKKVSEVEVEHWLKIFGEEGGAEPD